MRRILVTSALPYANGPIHLGHLVEYIQTDIWVRFQKSQGHDVVYVCADDTHGTAITLRARKESRSEVDLIAEMQESHTKDFCGFDIEFDHYGSTNSEENRRICSEIWQKLRDQGLIQESEISQLYDPSEGMFLADRFVQGNCPKCDAPDQYGDSCEKCGAVYQATELKNPKGVLSGSPLETRQVNHLFVDLEKNRTVVEDWALASSVPSPLQPEVLAHLKSNFFSEPLRPWDISRPAPYFGFEIPDSPGNYWYVWFDAPVGYISSTSEWCERTGNALEDYWSETTEIVHFIGKDIQYFHTLFWPTMLHAGGYALPSKVQVHGFLTVNGAKMSKSRGTLIEARTYLGLLDPAYLRYYYASKLSGGIDDIDLDFDDFKAKVNSDLVGKLVNLVSRTIKFTGALSLKYPDDGGLFEHGVQQGTLIAEAYERLDYAQVVRLCMALVDSANEYVAAMEPWKAAKDPDGGLEVQTICSVALNLYRQVVGYLSPILPKLAKDSAKLFSEENISWGATRAPLEGAVLGEYSPLMVRADAEAVSKMIDH